MNGTYVNDRKIGSRKEGESPEEGARRRYPEIDLKDGDRIKVGQTVLTVHVEAEAVCCQCSEPIAETERSRCAWIGGAFICLRLQGEADLAEPEA